MSVTVAGSAGPRPASGTNLVAALHAAEPQADVDATALLQNDARGVLVSDQRPQRVLRTVRAGALDDYHVIW